MVPGPSSCRGAFHVPRDFLGHHDYSLRWPRDAASTAKMPLFSGSQSPRYGARMTTEHEATGPFAEEPPLRSGENAVGATAGIYHHPLRLMLLIAVSVFVAELGVMWFLSTLPPLSLHVEALVDALLLSVFVFPVLYAFAFRPLIMHIAERTRAEDQVKRDRARLRALASEVVLTEERERRRLAADLQDRVSPSLGTAKMQLDALCRSGGLDDQLRGIGELVDEALRSTSFLTFELSPPILYDLGFEAAVQWLAENVQERSGIEVSFEDDRQPKPMDQRLSVVLFRAVRELLANVTRHAHANRAGVFVSREDDQVRVDVEDDGRGFPAGFGSGEGVGDKSQDGFGLFSIRQRLIDLGGRVEIHTRPGSTVVTLTVPLVPRAQPDDDRLG